MVSDETKTSQGTLGNYLVALLVVSVAWTARLLIGPVLGVVAPMLFFTLAIAVSAYRGGLGPGLLATLLGGGSGTIFLVPNLSKFSNQAAVALFFVVNLSIVAVCESLRRSQKRVLEKEQAAEGLLREVTESRAILDGMFENAPIGMAIYDRELRFVRLNAALAQIHGISLQEHIGRTIYELLPDLEPRLFESFRLVFQHGEPVIDMEITGYTPAKPGLLRAFMCNLYPVKSGAQVQYCCAIIAEITEKKESERALKDFNRLLTQSNEDLRQFGYAASHDLQEPLRMIASYTQLLDRRYGGQLDAHGKMYINFAVEGAHRIEYLLRGLREYWRVSEVADRESSPSNSGFVLERALRNLDASIVDTHASVTYDPLPMVLVDEVPLLQLFQNIVGNSLKYRHPDRAPKVHIRAIAKEASWIFSVRDNGIGIDPQYARQVFGLFKRLNGYKYAGAGMGLAICQKIVERFGGKIWVESQLDEGATFFFTLPNATIPSGDENNGVESHQISAAPAAGSHR